MLISNVARELGLSAKTVAAYAKAGKLKFETTFGGWRDFSPEDVARLRRELMERRKKLAR